MALCVLKGIDPTSTVSYPDPNGYLVARYRKAWVGYAIKLHEHWINDALVQRALKRLGSSS